MSVSNRNIFEEVKWGIIGCGDVTEIKSGPAFYKTDNSKLIAVMRRDAEKAEDYAKRHKVPKWYSNADDLINDPDVNAIYVATPPSSHAEYTIKAARSGKPVYIEKPMAANYAECLQMIEVCREYHIPLFVAYYRRMLPYFMKVKELVDSKSIGQITSVNIMLHLAPYERDLCKDKTNWRVEPAIAGAGYFYDLASHQFDYLDYLLGPIKSANGILSNHLNLYEAEDNVKAVFEFETGVTGSGSWDFAVGENSERDVINLFGTNGVISFSTFAKTPITIEKMEGISKYNPPFPDHVHQPLVETVVAELTGKGKCPSTGNTGARTNWVMDKILNKL